MALWMRDLQPDPWQIAATICEKRNVAATPIITAILRERVNETPVLTHDEAIEFVGYTRRKAL